MTSPKVEVKAEDAGYGVYLDEVRIGYVWKRPGRSFSGGWSGTHVSGQSAGSWNHTRKEAIERIVWLEQNA